MAYSKVSGKWYVIELDGRIDSFNHETVQIQVQTAISQGRRFLALDLQRTHFLSIPTIKLLQTVAFSLAANDGELAMCSLSEKLKRQISIFGSLDGIRTYRTVNDLPESSEITPPSAYNESMRNLEN